jgi:1,4-alpha-glucan branching enzyme
MQLLIHHQPADPHDSVFIHAWEPAGKVWDFEGEKAPNGHFRFQFPSVNLSDLRDFHFKYRFPDGTWEPDDYERQLPTTDSTEVWTFDYTPRCLTQAPGTSDDLTQITVHVISLNKYASGQLFLWQPGTTHKTVISQDSRNDANHTSSFIVPLQDWMRQGFHFKLKTPGDSYEPDRVNRVWRPSDGDNIWVKAGQLDLRTQPIELVTDTLELLYPATLTSTPLLNLNDTSDDYTESVPAIQSSATPDLLFRQARYAFSVYLDAIYSLDFNPPETRGDPTRTFRLRREDTPGTTKALYGHWPWLTELPNRETRVKLIIHPNPNSRFGPHIPLQVGVGHAPAHETLTAPQQPDGTWQVEADVFPNLLQYLELLPAAGLQEQWFGLSLSSHRREFTPQSGQPNEYHTLDGIRGAALEPPVFRDLSLDQRQHLMAAAFSPEIATANIFDDWEMPHGCIQYDGQTWFTLCAPHAANAKLLILDPASPDNGPRQVQAYPMSLTTDLRYWWCAIPTSEAPHGTYYRFQLNHHQEVLDPAARWVHDGDSLYAQPNEGRNGSWSRVLDIATLHRQFQDSRWKTMGWDALLIYEMHAKRLTRRNPGARSVFEQLIYELKPEGYLKRLGVTALELLPLHEFPKDNSWGYNPSLFFVVESSYGDPEDFARMVCTSHNAGKAVLLDLVYNHFVESPLQAVARDLYADGETEWGDMVNYDHPMVREFFRQALVYQWFVYRLDGFRFDCTKAIVDGHKGHGGVIKRRDGHWQTGSGGGWDFLKDLRTALRKAAEAIGQPWPYLVGENDPNNWGMTDRAGVLDGQWHFAHHYPLAEAAYNTDDKVGAIRQEMNYPHSELRPYYEAVRYAESHDSVSDQEPWKQRIAKREVYGHGRRMAKAIGTATLLTKGIPMLFMGEEAGEHEPFHFGQQSYLRLDEYEQSDSEMHRIYRWFQHMMGLRNNPDHGFRGDDDQAVQTGHKTLAFTRGWGRFFVICTFGTPDTRQNVGWLGLPPSTPYKEILNSTWPFYQVDGESERSNGGYDARIYSGQVINLPYIGAVVLERCC